MCTKQQERRVIGTLYIPFGDRTDKTLENKSDRIQNSKDAASSTSNKSTLANETGQVGVTKSFSASVMRNISGVSCVEVPLKVIPSPVQDVQINQKTTQNTVATSSETAVTVSASTTTVSSSVRSSDMLASPGARSDITVAYEDPEAPSPRTPSPTRFLSPTCGLSWAKITSRSEVPSSSNAVCALGFNKNQDQLTASQNGSQSSSQDSSQPHKIEDPIHPPTPRPMDGLQTDGRDENSDLLDDINSFANRADPVHMPSPQHVRTDSPVSGTSLNRSRNVTDTSVSPRRPTNISVYTPPAPSLFSALTSSPEIPVLQSPVATEEDREKLRLITSARNRINQEVER